MLKMEVMNMSRIKEEDIIGYRFMNPVEGEKIVCPECVIDEDLKDLRGDEILDSHDVEGSGELFFCDRCQKQIGG